jgi:hypothetical protein
MCIYEALTLGLDTYRDVLQPESGGTFGSTGRWGAILFVRSASGGLAYSFGTWAATSAAGSSAASAASAQRPAGANPLR